MKTLCLDIGSGTQDVLLYSDDRTLENCPKFVLPTPAKQVAARITTLTAAGRSIHLAGGNMGGGFFRALKAHLAAGLPVSAHPEAALALFDDPARLVEMGATICQHPPAAAAVVRLADYDPGYWRAFLAAAGVDEPDDVMACAQDHGFHGGESNRVGRFALWERFLDQGQGRPENLIFKDVPPELTRLVTLQHAIGGGLVADTGAAAVLGALWQENIEAKSQERGITLVNVGNSHIIAFLLFGGRMWGVYEHHTGMVDADRLWADLEAFRAGRLTFGNVFDAGGHGCLRLEAPAEAGDFSLTFVLGPQRTLLEGRAVEFPSPGGDMMLAGCLGLLKGRALRAGA